MNLFDLLLLVSALGSVVSLVMAATLAIRGHRQRAGRRLRRLGIFVLVYLGLSILVSFLKPQRVLAIGDPWCFDDWCLAVDRVTEGPADSYTTDLRLMSSARGISQRANGAWIYLIDQQGQRYAPVSAPDEVPLDVMLGPGEVRQTTRRFIMPAGVRPIGLVTGHGGGYCGMMNLLIIGNATCLFGKPTMIGLANQLSGTE
jgi:hypothetical protein